jgi:hypothetical protein
MGEKCNRGERGARIEEFWFAAELLTTTRYSREY